jgi:hypothetical protein
MRESKEKSPSRVLSLLDFERALVNLSGSKVSKLVFSGYAENFLNPDLPNMILLADSLAYRVEVVTTGLGLSLDIAKILANIDFVRFAFSVQPLDSKARPGIEDPKALMELIMACSKVLQNVHLDVVWPYSAKDHHSLVDIRSFANENGLHFRLDWHDRAGNLYGSPSIDNQKSSTLFYCSRPIVNVLQPNGDLALCCMDWSLKHILGNLYTQKYTDIISADVTMQVLKALHGGELKGTLCRHCHYLEEVNEQWVHISERDY